MILCSGLNFALLFLFAGLPVAAAESSSEPILVAAAADLAPLEVQLTQGFASAGGGPVRFIFGSSGMLARQIENGALYDVYLSANEQFVQQLAASGRLLNDTLACYATGRLGLWSSRAPVPDLRALTGGNIRLIAIPNPQHAPYGAAAVALLQRLGLWPKLQPKAVFAENVRQAFEYAATGNADAVITAWTLLSGRPGAKLLPDTSHPPIRQSGGVVKGTAREARARAFLRFLLAPAGQAILRAGGLYPPPAAPAAR
ncbi:MAG: molybdate ABC transporter substrate-binding protein [Bryobacteraceae bacterium]|jgi:molybdate transport system substrate-binding protein